MPDSSDIQRNEKSDFREISLHNLSYKYENAETFAFENVSLTFSKGEKIMIIGTNGAGKSTLVKVLTGLYKPISGEVIYNGNESINTELSKYCDVGMMLQNEPVLSLRCDEYISIGKTIDSERIDECISKVKLDNKVSAFSDGIHSVLGKGYSNGEELSGGEWQRMSYARLLYCNPDVIILDEPSSNMDPLAELRLYKDITELFDDKLVIMISHRLTAKAAANRIIVMDNGQIREDGSHEELIQKQGIYFNMFNKQKEEFLYG